MLHVERSLLRSLLPGRHERSKLRSTEHTLRRQHFFGIAPIIDDREYPFICPESSTV